MNKKGVIRWGVSCFVISSFMHFGVMASHFSQTYSHRVVASTDEAYVWHETKPFSFNELIVSWNALRPKSGKFTIFSRVKGKKWSGWIKCAEWGAMRQQSFSSSKDEVARLDVDAITLKNNVLATEFEVKVEASAGANLHDMHLLHACASNTNKYEIPKPSHGLESGFIKNVPQQSQMVLKHRRFKALCSPTATSTVVSYFLKKNEAGATESADKETTGAVDPADFADLVYDAGHKIYGNWALNVAAAYDVSGGKVPCRVERLAGFDALHALVSKDRPVVVSIQGPLKGGALPYCGGHLMVVIGWDDKERRVLCIDSAFASNKATKVWYDSDEFCKAWGRRKNLSYVFMPLS